MFKSLLRDRKLLMLLTAALVLRLFATRAEWVEQYYTYGFYPLLSKGLRWLLGWVPFSVGDLLYVAAFVWLVLKTWKLVRLLARREMKEYLSHVLFRKYLRLILGVYLVFNLFWGLNYDRQGIAAQLGLQTATYDSTDLLDLNRILIERVNFYAAQIDTAERPAIDRSAYLFREAVKDFRLAEKEFPFLQYAPPSLKPSLFSYMAHYFGFTGYFNPFTSEAQLNVDEPVFVKPFVVNHEIAHQLGYGKENEASFVSFLASKHSANLHTRYSLYYELLSTAFRESLMANARQALQLYATLHPRVRRDRLAERQWKQKRRNKMAPLVSDFYDGYLRLNNQPKGLQTYNEVIAWLIAYRKKYGAQAI
jgi:hypothetical protein